MNEQQNSKLNAHREMLSKRKDEISRMDSRIQELQQRLKKKKAQQAEQQKQNNTKGSSRPIGAIEPYMQYSNKPENADDVDLKSGFAKQDPKYQTLPTNTKFSLPEKPNKSSNKENEGREQNNNNNSKDNQLRIPLSVNVSPDAKALPNGFSQNQLSDSIIKAAQRHQNMTATTNSSGHHYSAPPPIPARAATTGLTYLAPRPFGSTYSTNALTNRIQAPVSSINVQDEVRTSGSGQSSPASSEGSQKEVPRDVHATLINDPLQPTGAPTIYNKQDQVDSSRIQSAKVGQKESNSNGQDNSSNSVTNGNNTTLAKQPMRYASKNHIANTYMGRLGPDAMKKYQQNFNLLYNGGNTSENVDSAKDPKSNEQIKTDSVELSPTRHQHSPHSPGSPHYTDIASDKVSHNRNTPRTIRRRHSDSENEEMTKLLQKYNVHSPQNQHVFNFNNIQHETQATSFMDQIPEKVPVDDMGNLMDVQVADDKNSDSNSSSSISPMESPKIEQNNDNIVRRKKTNLKNANSIKNSNRVSFDPLALLLDASLEGELELVKRCASQVGILMVHY